MILVGGAWCVMAVIVKVLYKDFGVLLSTIARVDRPRSGPLIFVIDGLFRCFFFKDVCCIFLDKVVV